MMKSEGGGPHSYGRFFASTPLGQNQELRMEFNESHYWKDEPCLIVSNLNEGELNGQYREYSCDGELLISGNYCKIDTLINNKIVTVNPESYITEREVITQTKFPKKIGLWRYFNTSGAVINEEKYNDCH